MLKQCAPEGLHPMEETHAGAVDRRLPWERPHAGAGKECEEFSH